MRKYYIDNLRWITFLMLIPCHAAIAWNVWGEPNYIYYGSSQVISSIVVAQVQINYCVYRKGRNRSLSLYSLNTDDKILLHSL